MPLPNTAICGRSSIWLEHSPVTGEAAGSSPVDRAKFYTPIERRTVIIIYMKKYSYLSIISFVVSLIGVGFFVSAPFQVHPDLSSGIMISTFGALLGIIALIKIDRNKETQKGRVFCVLAMIFPIIIIALFFLALSGLFG